MVDLSSIYTVLMNDGGDDDDEDGDDDHDDGDDDDDDGDDGDSDDDDQYPAVGCRLG